MPLKVIQTSLIRIQDAQPIQSLHNKNDVDILNSALASVKRLMQQQQTSPNSVNFTLNDIQKCISTLKSLPSPQKGKNEKVSSPDLAPISDIEPTLEFYHASPKEAQSIRQYVLLRSWETGRLQRWRKWHNEQLNFLIQEEQRLARKNTFINQLKSNHPWMTGITSLLSEEDEAQEQQQEENTHRIRQSSDSILSSVSKFLQNLETTDSKMSVDDEQTNRESRKAAIFKLNQARGSRYTEKVTQKEELNMVAEYLLIDTSDDEEEEEQTVPTYMQESVSPEQFLLQKRHKFCVEMYEYLQSLRISYLSVNVKQYQRLVAKYDVLLESFNI